MAALIRFYDSSQTYSIQMTDGLRNIFIEKIHLHILNHVKHLQSGYHYQLNVLFQIDHVNNAVKALSAH